MILAAEGVETLSGLSAWGPLGIFAALQVVALRVMWKLVVDVLKADAASANTRADKVQTALDKQNEMIQDKVITALVESNAASRRMLDYVQRAERP